ncbi:MAG TPA: serine hydrolase domain-containing protein, partial [Burkholderiales bacterium]|nr:serine hydrolase domain-containing protein [Burkholderiales bacterium]
MKPALRTGRRAARFSATRRDVLKLGGVGLLAPNLLYACGGSDGPYSATIADARASILQAIADSSTPSASAALIDGERVVWAEGFGLIDKATGEAPGVNTRFGIGSVSKMFATVATMILWDRGLVDLDAPLVSYVKSFRMLSSEYTRVTVRMLLSHSPGFPGTEFRNSTTTVPVPGYARQVEETVSISRLQHAPGYFAVYCDDGFAMIELVVSAVTGKAYVEFVQEEILAPLGMTHSGYTLSVFPVGTYAPAYRGEARQPLECLNCYGGGGLYSTPSDMGRLAIMLMNDGVFDGRRILTAKAVAEMARDQTAALPFNPIHTYPFGLGWDGVRQVGMEAVGVTTWHKNGGTVFYSSELFVAPVERLAVFIAGTGSCNPARLCELILLRALAERGTIAMPVPLPSVVRPERAPGDADFAAMAGCYGRYDALVRLEPQPDRTLTLYKDADGVWMEAAVGLKLRDDGTWSSDAQPRSAYRTLVGDGRRYLVRRGPGGYRHYEQEDLFAQRVVPGPVLSSAWQARLNKTWLAVNQHALAISPVLKERLHAVPELPGYVVTNAGMVVDASVDDVRGRMCLQVPMFGGMYLNDVEIVAHGGEEWLRVGSVLFVPQASIVALAAGSHAVAAGAEGYGEWRKLPATGAVTIAGCISWVLCDADVAQLASGLGGGQAALPGKGVAAYLLIYGAPGTV